MLLYARPQEMLQGTHCSTGISATPRFSFLRPTQPGFTIAMLVSSLRAQLLLGLLTFWSCNTAATASKLSRADTSNSTGTILWGSCDRNLSIPLQCATLDVPLDYTATGSNAPLLTLKLVRLPSAQQPSKGSILLNRGGPGLGGRNFVVELGAALQEITGGSFDLVSWDPRGSGDTLRALCVPGEVERTYQGAVTPPASNESDATVGLLWSLKSSLASACVSNLGENATLLGTAFVARDMLRIVEGLGGDGLLNYFGFSYGSVLGMTFAAMFPDKVGRIIVDGVLNPSEYYAGRDVQQIADTDAVFAGFVTFCQVYPDGCALASYARGKTQSLLHILKQLLEDLKLRPLGLGPNLLTQNVQYGALKFFILKSLYNPSTWPSVATHLRAVLDKDGAALASIAASSTNGTTPPAFPPDTVGDPIPAIRCSDNAFRSDNLTDVMPLVDEFYQQGWFAGDLLTGPQPLTCSQWQVRAKEVYSGGFQNITTRNPLLFIGNTFDPVTPLISARNASAAFVGSAVLVQNGYGHTTLAQSSRCTNKHIQNYFLNGTLPPPGTVCQTDFDPFEPLPTSGPVIGLRSVPLSLLPML